MGACTPFTFIGLVYFLIFAEKQVGYLGDIRLERSNAARQLVHAALIVLATGQHLPTTIVERNQVEHHQMRLMFVKNP